MFCNGEGHSITSLRLMREGIKESKSFLYKFSNSASIYSTIYISIFRSTCTFNFWTICGILCCRKSSFNLASLIAFHLSPWSNSTHHHVSRKSNQIMSHLRTLHWLPRTLRRKSKLLHYIKNPAWSGLCLLQNLILYHVLFYSLSLITSLLCQALPDTRSLHVAFLLWNNLPTSACMYIHLHTYTQPTHMHFAHD